MRREHSIPLVLWLCAALCLHFVGGGAGYVRAKLDEDLDFFANMGAGIPASGYGEVSIDVSPEDVPDESKKEKAKPKAKAKAKDKPDAPKPKSAELAKKEPEAPATSAVPVPVKPIKPRQAVIQSHAPEEKDNPEARFEAEQAHRTEEETVARIRNRDVDDKDPSPGGRHSSDNPNPGNSDEQKIAGHDSHAGQPSTSRAGAQAGQAARAAPTEPKPAAKAGGGLGQAAPGARAGGADAPLAAEKGWTLDIGPTRPGGKSKVAGDASGAAGTGKSAWLGLGATSAPGQINLNLSHQGVVGSVGEAALARDRQAEREERRSRIAGAWQASGLERWRSAIENYVPDVRPGNQTSLNAAHSPFASYIVKMHNRIHPLFAESFISSLNALPKTDAINDESLYAVIEVAISPDDGHLVKAGVIHHSGVTAFDVGALDAIGRAGPFGKAPPAIVSYNGNVYMHWTFHRNGNYCHHGAAAPFLLGPPDASKPDTGAHSENVQSARAGTPRPPI